MAISMSGASVDDSLRQELIGKSVDSGFASNGVSANTEHTGGFLFIGGEDVLTGASFAGISTDFEANITKAIDTYISDVNAKLDELESTASPSDAFKGSAVEKSLSTFVESVKNIAKAYVTDLQNAENQIIASVHTAYYTQDTDLSTNLNSDSQSINES